jgi:transitional endoplasmic reticulum ATPase
VVVWRAEGRLEILKIKTRNMKLSPDIDLALVAKDTHGFVGADISQVCIHVPLRGDRRADRNAF